MENIGPEAKTLRTRKLILAMPLQTAFSLVRAIGNQKLALKSKTSKNVLGSLQKTEKIVR